MNRAALVLVVLGAGSLATGAAEAQPLLNDRVDKELPAILEIYKTLHANPELSHFEEKTAALVAKELKAAGCQVLIQIGKYPNKDWQGHGVAGVLTNGEGPVVLIRAELDALPLTEKTGLPYASKVEGVAHCCGHDLHLAAMLGTARLLAAQKDRWRGTVVFIGQPSEEKLDGALAMMADGLFKKVPRPNYCLALHCEGRMPSGEVALASGPALMSVQSLEIIVRGKGGHGATPQLAKDPVVLAAQIILALQTVVSREANPFDPTIVSVGAIRGGTVANIIPEEVTLQVAVQAKDDEARDHALKAVERICKGTAQAFGMPDDLTPIVRPSATEKVSAVYNDSALSERLMTVIGRQLGVKQVVRVKQQPSADDFAYFGKIDGKAVPCVFMFLGATDPQKVEESRRAGVPVPANHNPRFAPVADSTLRTAMRTLTSAVLDLLQAEKSNK